MADTRDLLVRILGKRIRQVLACHKGGDKDSQRQAQKPGRHVRQHPIEQQQHSAGHHHGANGAQQLVQVAPMQALAARQ